MLTGSLVTIPGSMLFYPLLNSPAPSLEPFWSALSLQSLFIHHHCLAVGAVEAHGTGGLSGTHGSRVRVDFLQRVTPARGGCQARQVKEVTFRSRTLKAEWQKHWERRFGPGGGAGSPGCRAWVLADHSPGPQFPC